MKPVRISLLVVMAAVGVGSNAVAQVQVLPDYAYDAVAQVSLASTAAQACPKITGKDRPMQKAMQSTFKALGKDGISSTAALEHLKGDYAIAQLDVRADAFQEKHGLGEGQDEAFCNAVAAEAKDDRTLGKMMRISR